MPPEYAGGLGEAGVDALEAFVEAGGTLVCLDQAGGLAIDAFDLPIRDVARDAGERALLSRDRSCACELDSAQPLAFGMTPQTAGVLRVQRCVRTGATPGAQGPGGRRPPAGADRRAICR